MDEKPWVMEDMIEKMDKRRKWENVKTEEGFKRHKAVNNQLWRAAEVVLLCEGVLCI